MKLHYVYYAVTKRGKQKVGATSNPKSRFRGYLSYKLLEAYECPWKCGDREIELQLQYFGKRDSNFHYAEWLEKKKNIDYSVFQTEEYRKKISEANYKSYASGNRKPIDMSYRTDEYKEKISKASKEMWKNPERRKYSLKAEDNPASKLSNDDVRFIRKSYHIVKNQFCVVPNGKYSPRTLGKMFNISSASIWNIIKGKTYTSVN